jgi:hypothetical protein
VEPDLLCYAPLAAFVNDFKGRRSGQGIRRTIPRIVLYHEIKTLLIVQKGVCGFEASSKIVFQAKTIVHRAASGEPFRSAGWNRGERGDPL